MMRAYAQQLNALEKQIQAELDLADKLRRQAEDLKNMAIIQAAMTERLKERLMTCQWQAKRWSFDAIFGAQATLQNRTDDAMRVCEVDVEDQLIDHELRAFEENARRKGKGKAVDVRG